MASTSSLVIPPSSSSSSSSPSSSLPSFFEVYASQNLNAALRPAFRFALDVLAVRHPLLRAFSNHSDEAFTLLQVIVEATQLWRHSSLLCESFYSLCRRRDNVTTFGLTRTQVILSLLFDIVLPYVRVKVDALQGGAAAALFERDDGDDDDDDENDDGNRRTLTSRLLKAYKNIRACVDIGNLLMNVLYLYQYSRFFSLSLWIQRLVITRADDELMLQQMALKRLARVSSSSSSSSNLSLSRVIDRVLSILKATFVSSIVAFRFLQYYYEAEEIPPPERLPPVQGVDKHSATAPGKCPLCLQARVNSTACLTSGYVFCYLCIISYVQTANKCPVTYAPTQVDDLVRVYDIS